MQTQIGYQPVDQAAKRYDSQTAYVHSLNIVLRGMRDNASLDQAVEASMVSKPLHVCHCTADSPCKKDGICRCMAGLQAKLAGVTK